MDYGRSKSIKQMLFGDVGHFKSRLCDNCLASVGKGAHPSMHGRNYSKTAAWRMTRLDHEAYLDHEVGERSPYIQIPGFRIETVVYDWLHNIYLGCGRDLFASGLKLLIAKGTWSHLGTDNVDAILAGVHSEMHHSCAAYGFLGCKCPSPWPLQTCQCHHWHRRRPG